MTKTEQRIEERALELYYLHDEWCWLKALSAAAREEKQRQQARKEGKVSVRPIGLLEGW